MTLAEAGTRTYAEASPWPHMVMDGFLPAAMADAAAEEFPGASDSVWLDHGREFRNQHARKLELSNVSAMPPALRKVVAHVHSPVMVERIRELTGIDDIEPDPNLYGGGLNLVEPGGFLDRHVDYNWSSERQQYRICNLILYMNRGWKPGHGGELELWADGELARKVEPRFNRAVLFTCTRDAMHGYGPVKAPRRSMSFWFFRNDPLPGISAAPHRTLWA
jgi:Rps23 Pro-64 3,4-dihydroxylase Tpa1-like proline 4-hydroxylase